QLDLVLEYLTDLAGRIPPVVLGTIVVADDRSADDGVGDLLTREGHAEGAGQLLEHLAEDFLLEIEVGRPILEGFDVDRPDVGGEPAATGQTVVARGNAQQAKEHDVKTPHPAPRAPAEKARHARPRPVSGSIR